MSRKGWVALFLGSFLRQFCGENMTEYVALSGQFVCFISDILIFYIKYQYINLFLFSWKSRNVTLC
ncbi:hypothetical protein SY86_20820 [Erwinia tracheiphila]|uniref:Uncharacterized protein n=1 Tax=Erwinia tracheiphila TaxID=65700 RepID=A0A0M2KED4_9GAMM|nr:hypothetical protein ETR_07546 [Erwinia tracheiphila PSU-1]KKF37294.1 hypothetical protein SY86_20820 [Erwinia tracheiphila]